jgi:hypothetical protein
MMDSYLLFAPFFLLAVLALIGFVGCSFTPGAISVSPPQNLRFTASDGRVDLFWDSDPNAIHYNVLRGDVTGVHASIGDVSETMFSDTTVTNGKSYFYVVTAFLQNSEGNEFETGKSNEVEALPLGAFVRSPIMPGTPSAGGRAGFFGMEILVGSNPIKVYSVGRVIKLGMAQSHDVIIIDAQTMEEKGRAPVDKTLPPVGDFVYRMLSSPVTLSANLRYYVLSEEFAGGDPFYEQDTVVTTRPEASVQNAIENSGPGVFTTAGGPGHSYGPVSFQY